MPRNRYRISPSGVVERRRSSTISPGNRIPRNPASGLARFNQGAGFLQRWGSYIKPVGYAAVAAGSLIAGKLSNQKLKQSVNRNQGMGASFSKYSYGKRKIPKAYGSLVKRGLSTNYQVVNGSGRITAAVGLQGAADAFESLHQAELATIIGNVGASKTQKVMLLNVSGELALINQDSGNVRITIYDCMARRDIDQANIATPSVAWSHSYLDEGGANSNWSLVGTTPFSSDTFTKFWKICKITSVALPAGGSHVHRLYFACNKVLDYENIQYTSQAIRGLTICSMVVVQGLPYNDSTTKTQVSTGACNVDYVSRRQIRYTYLSDSTTNYFSSNNIPGSFTVAEAIMSEASGVSEADNPA